MGQMKIKGLSVFFDNDDAELIRRYNWHLIKTRRNLTHYVVTVGIGPREVRETIYMHRLVMGLWRGNKCYTDHIDKNGLNNYRSNLRIVTASDNNGNMRKRSDAKWSQYKGVSFYQQPGLSHPWVAQIKYHGKATRKTYRTEIEAARAYNEMAIEVFGPMANLNIIRP
jgi:hypothetical protein